MVFASFDPANLFLPRSAQSELPLQGEKKQGRRFSLVVGQHVLIGMGIGLICDWLSVRVGREVGVLACLALLSLFGPLSAAGRGKQVAALLVGSFMLEILLNRRASPVLVAYSLAPFWAFAVAFWISEHFPHRSAGACCWNSRRASALLAVFLFLGWILSFEGYLGFALGLVGLAAVSAYSRNALCSFVAAIALISGLIGLGWRGFAFLRDSPLEFWLVYRDFLLFVVLAGVLPYVVGRTRHTKRA